jgi:hypothetical protein
VIKKTFTTLTIISLLAIIITFQWHLEKMRTLTLLSGKTKVYKTAYTGYALRVLSFGFRDVMADFLWLRALQNLDTEIFSDNEVSWLYVTLDAATELDPEFTVIYRLGGIYLSVMKRDKLGAHLLLEKGIQKKPNDWLLYYYLGYHYLYELNDIGKASLAMWQAASRQGGPEWLWSLAEKLTTQFYSYQTSLGFLTRFLETVTDKRIRKQVEKRIQMLKLKLENPFIPYKPLQ